MADWQVVCAIGELAPGEHRVAELETGSVLVVNVAGEFYAVENFCPHDGGDLNGGEIEGHTVTCPRHGACFCLKTGRVLKPPAFEDLRCFPVRTSQGRVEVLDEPRESN